MRQIRKISIGIDPKDCLAYVVGSLHNGGTIKITNIIKEQGNRIRFYIWAEEVGANKSPFIWQEVFNVPVLVQYFLEETQ